MIDENSFYTRLANDLITKTSGKARKRKGHALCIELDEVARAISPATYTDKLGGLAATALIRLGAPGIFARLAGASAGLGVKLAMSHTPVGQAATVLRTLVPLVCPDLGNCPVRAPIINAYVGPAVAHELRAFQRAMERSLFSGSR